MRTEPNERVSLHEFIRPRQLNSAFSSRLEGEMSRLSQKVIPFGMGTMVQENSKKTMSALSVQYE